MADAREQLLDLLDEAIRPTNMQLTHPKIADANREIARLSQALGRDLCGAKWTNIVGANKMIATLTKELAAMQAKPAAAAPTTLPSDAVVTKAAPPAPRAATPKLSRAECLAALTAMGYGAILFIGKTDAEVHAEAVKRATAAGVSLPGMPAAVVDASLSPRQKAMRSIRADLVAAALRDSKPRKIGK